MDVRKRESEFFCTTGLDVRAGPAGEDPSVVQSRRQPHDLQAARLDGLGTGNLEFRPIFYETDTQQSYRAPKTSTRCLGAARRASLERSCFKVRSKGGVVSAIWESHTYELWMVCSPELFAGRE